MKWVHLAAARNQLEAEMWQGLLVEEGFSAVIRPGDTASFLGVSAYPCRILVAEDQLERAKQVLQERLGRGHGG